MENKVLKSLIIPPQKWIKIRYKKPYILNFKNKDQEIICFGVEHSNNYKDGLFKKMEEFFEEFRKENKLKKIIILAEGFLPEKNEGKEKLIKKYGEAGMLYYLAKKNKIRIESIEPTLEEIIKETIKDGYKNKQIILWLFINLLWGKLGKDKKNRDIKEKDLKEAEKTLLIIYEKLKFLRGRQYLSIDFLMKQFKKETKKDILKLKIDKIKKFQSPFKNDFSMNKIFSHINFVKDYFMAKKIIKRLKEKKSVFAVLGHNHVVAQKDALKKIMDN